MKNVIIQQLGNIEFNLNDLSKDDNKMLKSML